MTCRNPVLSATRQLVLAVVILSVHLSVTIRHWFKPRWDRGSGFLSHDSL